jgi:hypothetical protein
MSEIQFHEFVTVEDLLSQKTGNKLTDEMVSKENPRETVFKEVRPMAIRSKCETYS